MGHPVVVKLIIKIVLQYDSDGDGKLTEKEYITDPYKDLDQDDIKLKQKEFQLILDKNKDGIADKREVVNFLDPKNPHWSRYEAINLLSEADTNYDNMLELDEVLAKPDLFLFSKLVSGDVGFHGEF